MPQIKKQAMRRSIRNKCLIERIRMPIIIKRGMLGHHGIENTKHFFARLRF